MTAAVPAPFPFASSCPGPTTPDLPPGLCGIRDALADLVHRVEDDAAGFARASERATSVPLRRLLADRAAACRGDAQVLRSLLVAEDGDGVPAGDGLSRWPVPRDALGGSPDGALVEDCLTAEQHTVLAWRQLLDRALPVDMREPLAAAAARARESHRVLGKLVALERDHVV